MMYHAIALCMAQVALGTVAQSHIRCLDVSRTLKRRHTGGHNPVHFQFVLCHFICHFRNELIRKLKLYNASLAKTKLTLSFSEVNHFTPLPLHT